MNNDKIQAALNDTMLQDDISCWATDHKEVILYCLRNTPDTLQRINDEYTLESINTPAKENADYVDIVFDKLPGPEGCQFIEVENAEGKSIRYGEWVERPDGYAAIRITALKPAPVENSGPVQCQRCNGDGYTVDVEASCCTHSNDDGSCCGNPIPEQVQRPCDCGPVDDKAGMGKCKRRVCNNIAVHEHLFNHGDMYCHSCALKINDLNDPKCFDLVQPSSEGVNATAPIAFRVKDFADGWILSDNKKAVDEARENGHLIQPLYALSNSVQDGENSDVVMDTFNPTHRHRKRGTLYQLIGDAVMQCEEEVFDNKRLTLYRGEDGKYWVRPPSEFNDGRFAAHEKESKA